MSFNVTKALAMAGVLAFAIAAVPGASASHIDFEQRRAEREAEREARRLARENDEPTCTCSARLSYGRPSLQFSGGTLNFIPRVDVAIRSRGDHDAPAWSAQLDFDGSSSYTSDDVSVPDGSSFSGTQQVAAGSCGHSFTFQGLSLPAVSLAGITRSLVGEDQELKGAVHLHSALSGCGQTKELNKSYSFRLRELGNLRLGSWRSVR